MIREIQGNLLQQPVDIIAHQTNCKGVMGAGIAKQIKERLLPQDQYQRYVDACNRHGAKLLGQAQVLFLPNGKVVSNCFGENIPTGTGLDTDYQALMHALAQTRNYARKYNLSTGVPGLMGCGLAGGDWNIVRDMLYKLWIPYPDLELIICYYDLQEYLKWNPVN